MGPRRLALLVLLSALTGVPARAAGPMTWLIDTPTAEVSDHYGYNLAFRLYSGGGVLTKTSFGIFPRLNLGFGLDAENFIGSDTVDVNPPTLNVRWRFFDGKRDLPALSLGYDGQGYFYNDATDKYVQREKGLYLVGSGEIVTPGLSLHGGGNIYDFNEDKVFAFGGLTYLHQDFVGLVFESDNIGGKARDIRLNGSLRAYITPSLSVDVGARDLWAASRESERIVLINYFGSF
jgi:hypothetical protein